MLAETAEVGVRLLCAEHPDAVLISNELPGQPHRLLRTILQLSDAPILVLAKSNSEPEQIEALWLGADDYIVEPVSAALLAARIETVRRRGLLARRINERPDFQVGELAVWFRRQNVTAAGEVVRLTPLEYKLLRALVRNAGEVVPSQVLLDLVWGPDYGATTRYLKVFVNRLRSKLERTGGQRYIQTEPGIGYHFVPGDG